MSIWSGSILCSPDMSTSLLRSIAAIKRSRARTRQRLAWGSPPRPDPFIVPPCSGVGSVSECAWEHLGFRSHRTHSVIQVDSKLTMNHQPRWVRHANTRHTLALVMVGAVWKGQVCLLTFHERDPVRNLKAWQFLVGVHGHPMLLELCHLVFGPKLRAGSQDDQSQEIAKILGICAETQTPSRIQTDTKNTAHITTRMTCASAPSPR